MVRLHEKGDAASFSIRLRTVTVEAKVYQEILYNLFSDHSVRIGMTPPRTLNPRPLLPPERKIIFSRGFKTYPYLPERRFRTTTNVMTTATKKQESFSKDTPPTPAPPSGEADDIAQRDYNLPIPSRKAIPDEYERKNDNHDRDEKVKGGDILVVEAGQPNTQRNNTN